MRKPEDLTGRRFGKLTAVKRIGKDSAGTSIWECQCKCGNTHTARINHLKSGDIRSCGCLRDDSKSIQYKTRYDAWNRGYDFAISKRYLMHLRSKSCHYCGAPATGVDRQNNDKGYVEGNVLPCCVSCNRMKMEMDYDRFIEKIERIHRYLVVRKHDKATE